MSSILVGPNVDADVLRAFLTRRAPSRPLHEREALVCAYGTYGRLTTIGNLLPFAQGWKETAGFTAARWVQSFNPAGLGATNDGAWGGDFCSVESGVLAQYAHLLAYAVKPAQASVLQRLLIALDPRLEAVTAKGWRGVATCWPDLNGRWAFPGVGYGESVLRLGAQISRP